MTITDKTILITGANRGLGQALVDEALRRGATRVYAASRQPIVHPDNRVTPVIMDVTDWAQIKRAVESVESVAQAIFDGLENEEEEEEEEIFPDPFSEMLAESWRTGVAKELERQNATLVPAEAIAA
jgi:NAD(P)-dependent dehydrogenase (short-subunit alcohol dehydrogenase family)